MSREIIIRAVVIFFLMSFTGAMKEGCNTQEDLLQHCTIALPVLSSPDIPVALTREELDKRCVELRAGIKCIDNYTDVCMPKKERMIFRKIYSGITGVVNDLCARGAYQDEYLLHADCVKRVRPEYEQCSKEYEVTLTKVSNHKQDSEYDRYESGVSSQELHLKTVCCSFQKYLECSENTVQRACGEQAALFTSQFLKRMSSNIIRSFCLEFRGPECRITDAAGQLGDSKSLLAIITFVHIATYLYRHLFPA